MANECQHRLCGATEVPSDILSGHQLEVLCSIAHRQESLRSGCSTCELRRKMTAH